MVLYVYKFFCENLGTILNLVGTILIAYSFGANRDRDAAPYTENKYGKKDYIAYFNHPVLFKIGMSLVIIGFMLQLKI